MLSRDPLTPESSSPKAFRFSGAFGMSVLTHAGFILLVYILLTLPQGTRIGTMAPAVTLNNLVWLDTGGPGGGGGGGGNHSVTPPHKLQTRGPDSLSVPVAKAPPLDPPKTIVEPRQDPPPLAMVLPVRAMDSGAFTSIGTIQGSLSAPPNSRGPNDGPGEGPNGNKPGIGLGDQPGIGGGPKGPGSGVTPPQLIREVRPEYTPAAMRAKIQGEVWVSAVVLPNGTVGDLRVLRSLDRVFGLDEQALKCVSQWRFKPGTRLGQPVAVQINVSVGFGLR